MNSTYHTAPVAACGCSGGRPTQAPPAHRAWLKLAIAWVCAGQSMALSLGVNMTPPAYATPLYWSLHGLLAATALAVMVLLAGPLLRAQWQALLQRRITTEALFLVSLIGALGASILGTLTATGGIYYEVVIIVLSLYALGQRLQDHTRSQALKEADKLRADFNKARYIDASDQAHWVDIQALKKGATVLVKAGEPVPVDGTILRGQAFVQATLITGELEPSLHRQGQALYAGSYVVDAALWLQAEALLGERVLDTLLDSIHKASLAPSRLQASADRMVARFVPLALTISLGTFAFWLWAASWSLALLHAMAVLLVACPCAFGLATPLTVWRTLIALAQRGLVAQTGRLLDVLANVTHIIWDKTGTLSEDALQLQAFEALGPWAQRRPELEALLLALEQDLVHPIAQALRIALEAKHTGHLPILKALRIHPGLGLEGTLESQGQTYPVLAGALELMPASMRSAFPTNVQAKRSVYISIDNAPAAVLHFQETLRPEALRTLQALKERGLKLSILTGDPNPSWPDLAGIALQANCTPASKQAYTQKLAADPTQRLLFIGDGLNDLAAMSASAGSIALGQASPLVRAQASGILLSNRLDPLPEALSLAQRAHALVRSNLRFSLLYNCIAMSLAALGYIHPVLAALLMLGSSCIVSLRSKVA